MRFPTIPLLALGVLAGCADGPASPLEPDITPNHALAPQASGALLDAIERIVPSLSDAAAAAELRAALLPAQMNPVAAERVLDRLELDPSFAPDATAIRLAIAAR
jgi:hypothetical protein